MSTRRIKELAIVLIIFLGLSSLTFALTDEEILRKLDERFANGEISEKVYLKLQKKYGGGEGEVEQSTPKPEAKPAEGMSGNLAKNWSMEEDSDEDMMPDNWKKFGYFGYKDSGLSIYLDSEVKHTGDKSVCFLFPSADHHGGICQVIKVQPGKKYLFSFWIKGENLKGKDNFAMFAQCHPAEPDEKDMTMKRASQGTKVTSENFWDKAKGSFDWRRMVVKTKPLPQDAQYLSVFVSFYQGNPNSKLWMDDVVVVPMD